MFEYLNLTKEEKEEGLKLITDHDPTQGNWDRQEFVNWFKSLPPGGKWGNLLINVEEWSKVLEKLINSGNIDRAVKIYYAGSNMKFNKVPEGIVKILLISIVFIFGIVWILPSDEEKEKEKYEQNILNELECKEFSEKMETDWKFVQNECWFMNKNGWEKR